MCAYMLNVPIPLSPTPRAWQEEEISWVTAMHPGSNRCEQQGFDTSIIPGSPWKKALKDGVGQGRMEPAVSHSAGLITPPTSCHPLLLHLVMVSTLMIHAPVPHLASSFSFYAYLSFITLQFGSQGTHLKECSSHLCCWRDCIIWANRGRNRQNMSVILFSASVNAELIILMHHLLGLHFLLLLLRVQDLYDYCLFYHLSSAFIHTSLQIAWKCMTSKQEKKSCASH